MLKGPQGALYGRDAIGGAIIITDRRPPDHFEGQRQAGRRATGLPSGAGGGWAARLDSAGTLKYSAALNFYNTGWLSRKHLPDRKADPYSDYSGRLRLQWKPGGNAHGGSAPFHDQVQTTAYYYVIPRADEANVFSSFTTPPDANDMTSPIQTNNLGTDNRDIRTSLEAGLPTRLRHLHLDHGLQPHQGNRHRGRLRLPAHP